MRTRSCLYLIFFTSAVLIAAGCSTAPDPEAAKQSLKDLQTEGRIEEVSETNFVYSAQMSDLQVVDLYLASGMDPNVKNELGRTPLMGAAAAEESSPSYSRNVAVVNRLVEAGADVNLRDNQGDSAMTMATQIGRVQIVNILQEAGAKP